MAAPAKTLGLLYQIGSTCNGEVDSNDKIIHPVSVGGDTDLQQCKVTSSRTSSMSDVIHLKLPFDLVRGIYVYSVEYTNYNSRGN